MLRRAIIVLLLLLLPSFAFAEDEGFLSSAGNAVSGAAEKAWDWASGLFSGDESTPAPTTEPTPTPEPTPSPTPAPTLDPAIERYYLGTESLVNAGKDDGYSKSGKIGVDDPHFGWELGRFCVSGYTRVIPDSAEIPVFLKVPGDKVALWFCLNQDIDCLNGNSDLTIAEDTNGYDEAFGVPKTNFGHGTVVVRFTDYQNAKTAPQIYTDYLAANASAGANTMVQLFEEGDYEVALDYEIRKEGYQVFGKSVLPSYSNYRIYFKFAVRNGNCMVYPFDIATGAELSNNAVTENGFYLDLARSRYLDINVRRSVLSQGAAGLVEDQRFNRPAKDGDQYTQEGIYTITVQNRYTGEETVKQIFVGTDELLRSYIAGGLNFSEDD